jgi:hypothetical protein
MYIDVNKSISFYKKNGRLLKVIAHEHSQKFQVMQKRKTMEICYENPSGWYVQNRNKLLMFE